jgi:hypothetical protein
MGGSRKTLVVSLTVGIAHIYYNLPVKVRLWVLTGRKILDASLR